MAREFFGFVLFFLIIFIGIGALVLVPAAAVVAWQCGAYETSTGKPTKMKALECYVNKDGEWMLMEEYKWRYATNGAQK